MAEEQFFKMFTESLRESVSKLTPIELRSSLFKDSYLSKWNLCEDYAQPKEAVVACDGSIGESSFLGGLVILVARAIAHIYTPEGSLTSTLEVATEANYKLKGQALFMKTLELRALRNALKKALRENGSAIGIVDGSLYLTFLHHREHLKTITWIFEKYVRELASLLKLAEEGATIVGISKDSDVSYLRAKIMLDTILSLNADLEVETTRGRSIKRIREALSKKTLPKDSPLQACLKELDQDISDEGVYSELAPSPGFTTPLLLAPQTLFLTGEAKSGSWWNSGFRSLLQSDAALTRVLEALDEHFSRFPVALTYWRPRGGFEVYRVDMPSGLLGYEGQCGNLSNDVFMVDETCLDAMRKIIRVLNWMRQGPHSIYPLVEVDAVARLDKRLYKNAYEPVIMDELRKRGFKVNPRKRSIRDMVLRGY